MAYDHTGNTHATIETTDREVRKLRVMTRENYFIPSLDAFGEAAVTANKSYSDV
jgi:hypothetical protein